MTPPRTYDKVKELPLRIESYALESLSRAATGWTRHTTVFHLTGAGEEGLGEDVTYGEGEQLAQQRAGAHLDLGGDWTIDSFSAHLDGLDLFQGAVPDQHAYLDYRRWAFESAALDLALRQAAVPLHEALGLAPRPLRFAVSARLGDPPRPAAVLERIAAYGEVRFKLDAEPGWDDELLEALAGSGAVDVLDFKGHYKGTSVDVETDPDLYRRVAEAFPEALLEDPDLGVPEADSALEPFRERITWDAPIHSVDDVLALPFAPRALNSKPSRFGTIRRLFDFYDYCADLGISLYGGGQYELGVGRGQIQLLASLFHADGPNDVAPPGWDLDDWPRTGLPVTPLDPAPAATGFRRAG